MTAGTITAIAGAVVAIATAITALVGLLRHKSGPAHRPPPPPPLP